MFSIHLSSATTSCEQAAALIPALVPETWTGGASEACQRDLDEVLASLVTLEDLLAQADTAVAAAPDPTSLVCWSVP